MIPKGPKRPSKADRAKLERAVIRDRYHELKANALLFRAVGVAAADAATTAIDKMDTEANPIDRWGVPKRRKALGRLAEAYRWAGHVDCGAQARKRNNDAAVLAGQALRRSGLYKTTTDEFIQMVEKYDSWKHLDDLGEEEWARYVKVRASARNPNPNEGYYDARHAFLLLRSIKPRCYEVQRRQDEFRRIHVELDALLRPENPSPASPPRDA
eukprot:tig00000042_g15665.t1